MNYVLLAYVFYSIIVSLVENLVSSPKFKPFTYPRLYKVADRNFGMNYFSKKLGIENFFATYTALKRTKPYMDWRKELEVKIETVRDIDSCSLKKTDPRVRAEDAVSEMGNRKCFQQCKHENQVYFQFLNTKLQKLIKLKSCKVDIRISKDAVYKRVPKRYYSCSKKGYKKYICECSYQQYAIKASPKFEKTFDRLMEELYKLSPSPDNCKMLEEKYKMPAKLVAFVVSYHLAPTEIFGFLAWWYITEKSPRLGTTTPMTIDSSMSVYEDSESTFEADEDEAEDDEEEEEESEVEDED